VGLTGAGAAGTLPFPAWGVGALIALGERPRWELAGSYWPSRATTFPVSKGDALVNLTLFSAGPSVCVPFSTNAGLQFCSGAELGRMAAQSSGALTGPSEGASWWAAVSAGIAEAIPLTRAASVRVRIDLGIPFFRPDFVIDRPALGPGNVWRPSPVFARLSLEPELRISPTDASSFGH
jgi:hypothetical protein